MRILTINGIRTNGSRTTDALGQWLSDCGHEVIDINYPRVNIFTARSRKRQYRNAQRIMDWHKPGDVIVAHSYGCLLALRAMELGAHFSDVFYFGAAMNDDFVFPAQGMEKLHNIHNPHDVALTLGDLLWWHDFGEMGKTGYAGAPDARVNNILEEHEPDEEDSMAHSFYFYNLNQLQKWVNYINKEIANDW